MKQYENVKGPAKYEVLIKQYLRSCQSLTKVRVMSGNQGFKLLFQAAGGSCFSDSLKNASRKAQPQWKDGRQLSTDPDTDPNI